MSIKLPNMLNIHCLEVQVSQLIQNMMHNPQSQAGFVTLQNATLNPELLG